MFTAEQLEAIEFSTSTRVFLTGASGTGKTTCGIERLQYLIRNGVPANSILLLTPQRTLQEPYLETIHQPGASAGGLVTNATIGGLAKRMVELFWPMAIETSGFSHPSRPPVFLTLETAQYHMARLVRPHLDEGWFDSVVMDRNRLYSQIIDNLNKSAANGFPHTEIGDRLSAAWSGDPGQRRVYADTQACANEFRRYCLENNLLDFSLQLEVFSHLNWHEPILKDYLHRTYRHIIYDNIEEDIPLAHDIMRYWLPNTDSALLILDEGAGYRRFLGADPISARALADSCDKTINLYQSFITSDTLLNISQKLENVFAPTDRYELPARKTGEGSLGVVSTRFYPEMLDVVAGEIKYLIEQGIPPGEIVVLAPYLSDSLRFTLLNRLESIGVAARSHRPSRSLRTEPACRCLLTLAEIAHPEWDVRPVKNDVMQALMEAIDDMDLVRAHLLSEIVYRPKNLTLGSFEKINPEMQERISFLLGSRYEALRVWLESYRQETPLPLDHFLRRLFGEVLSQPGFRFHRSADAARVATSLIESVQKFRLSLSATDVASVDVGKEYVAMLQEGVIAAQYISAWSEIPEDAVLVAPAYTFLMSNRPVTIQFWLDVGSSGWYERLFQPLTHPYVLSRGWQPGREWTDADEVEANNDTLARLTTGLIRRCRDKIYICLSELGESGYEQRGVLLRAFNQVLSQEY